MNTPVLVYLDFSKDFSIETDASHGGIEAVLIQGHPIAYFSANLSGRILLASIYAKAMYAIIQAIGKWRHYLLGNQFLIHIDHHGIKNMVSQVIQIPEQQKFLCKMLGYKYFIKYKSSKENKVDDALSREFEDKVIETALAGLLLSLTKVVNPLVDNVSVELNNMVD